MMKKIIIKEHQPELNRSYYEVRVNNEYIASGFGIVEVDKPTTLIDGEIDILVTVYSKDNACHNFIHVNEVEDLRKSNTKEIEDDHSKAIQSI